MKLHDLPHLNQLTANSLTEGAVSIYLEEGIPIFRASKNLQNRMEELLLLNQQGCLTTEQEVQLNSYEEIDDYLSFINRTIRNIYLEEICNKL